MGKKDGINGRVRRTAKTDYYIHVRLSTRPHGKNSNPTGRISMKFDIWGFLENLSRKFNFH